MSFICPMHPEVAAEDPGACPKCGMTLEARAPPGAAPEWTCPMHAEVVCAEPGECPICGMALEPRAGAADEESTELRDMTRRFWVSAAPRS